jgi:hypothetical protein
MSAISQTQLKRFSKAAAELVTPSADPGLTDLIAHIKNQPHLIAADQEGFANTFSNPSHRNLAWTALGLMPFGVAASGLYALSRQPSAPKAKKKKPAHYKQADWKDTLFEVRRQLPGIHTPDIVGGALGGAALGGVYDWFQGNKNNLDKKERRRQTLKRILTGAAVGGFGANIIGDRARRHITNTLVPFGYGADHMNDVKPESFQDFYRSAILDKPAYKPVALKGLGVKEYDRRSIEELAARRELMRRAFGVHTNSPLKDMWQKNKSGYYSLNEKNPNYLHNLRMIFGPITRDPYNGIDDGLGTPGRGRGFYDLLTDPENTLRDANDTTFLSRKNVELTRPPDRQLDYSDLVDMLSSWQVAGGQQIPYKKDPAGNYHIQQADRYDLTPSKQETKHLRSYIRNIFNSRWKGEALKYPLDYMPPNAEFTNDMGGKSVLSRWLYDKVLSQETPWISQRLKLSPTTPDQQSAANQINMQDPDYVNHFRPENITSNVLPYSMQFLRENKQPAGPAISNVLSLEDWAQSRGQQPELSPAVVSAYQKWSG